MKVFIAKRGMMILLVLLALSGGTLWAQTAQLSGIIKDKSDAVIPNAKIRLVNEDKGIEREVTSNDLGVYTLPFLLPGNYKLTVQAPGFNPFTRAGLVLSVGEAARLDLTLEVGSLAQSVTVSGETPLISESPAVGTVVDRKYVENIPLNGRSFQNLILLTPGVVTNNPQNNGTGGVNGEFSVNGQRTESNYYTVDGVSANVGILGGFVRGASTGGSLPVSTALGTTQGLVSIDALEEFRVQSSTYSAEYGRNPGGQFSFVTRSGTNRFHGSAFEYLRNDVFDANDWFTNRAGLPRPALRQNDFGGTLGGPVQIPHAYNGKDKTFFFFSYEGLRLVQPQAASISFVPDTDLRNSAPPVLKPILNAFPVQNGPELGNGLAEFIGTWSNPGRLDSYSIRLDHALSQKLSLFFRFASTSSRILRRLGGATSSVPSNPSSDARRVRTYTFGSTSAISPRISNELRFNYSSNEDQNSSELDGFGGATATDLFALQGVSAEANLAPQVTSTLAFGAFRTVISQQRSSGTQRQWNVVDAVALSFGGHRFRFGIDLRRLAPIQSVASPSVNYQFNSAAHVQTNSLDFGFAVATAVAQPVYVNFSTFAQDEWRVTPKLSLSMGLRWEVNPAPGAASGNLPYTVVGSSLSTLTLAPQGTPLWETTWFNFAPRLGVAYVLRNRAGRETVVRGGVGVFFDSGQQPASNGYQGPGFTAQQFFQLPASFPLPPAQVTPPIVNPPVPPFTVPVFAFPAHLQLPYTLQWNASIQQSLGTSQSVTVSYVGANGRRLLGLRQNRITSVNPKFGFLDVFQNGLTSDYDSLQAQYQRRLAHGLQALASYTWAHSIDFGSQNTDEPFIRGNSAFDVRHSFSGALSYDLPNASSGTFARAVLHHWALDSRVSARTGFPVLLIGRLAINAADGALIHRGLNIVQDQPFYVFGSQYPGGRSINPAAFSLPPTGTNGNAPRNFLRAFGTWQMDLALRREFLISEKLKLQFRAEAFNIFNHPNLGTINTVFCTAGPGCTFGQATATLAQSLGVLSPLYQSGGPRSMQFALKVIF